MNNATIKHSCKHGAIVKLDRPLFCWIGLHNWVELGAMSLVQPWGTVFKCLCCHRREARYGYATVYSDPSPDGWMPLWLSVTLLASAMLVIILAGVAVWKIWKAK